jgi:metal-responsive CopG/Arc/MetJ family transcriptional regulator
VENMSKISATISEVIENQLTQYISHHNITKSEFIRTAVIEKLQDATDIETIETILMQNNKQYTHDEMMRELSL